MTKNLDIKENICNNIKHFLDNTPGMTNTKFGALFNVTEATVRGWRKNENIPSVKLFEPIANVLGITLIELLGLDHDNYLSPEDLALIKAYSSDNQFKEIVDKILNDESLKNAIYTIVSNSK